MMLYGSKMGINEMAGKSNKETDKLIAPMIVNFDINRKYTAKEKIEFKCTCGTPAGLKEYANAKADFLKKGFVKLCQTCLDCNKTIVKTPIYTQEFLSSVNMVDTTPRRIKSTELAYFKCQCGCGTAGSRIWSEAQRGFKKYGIYWQCLSASNKMMVSSRDPVTWKENLIKTINSADHQEKSKISHAKIAIKNKLRKNLGDIHKYWSFGDVDLKTISGSDTVIACCLTCEQTSLVVLKKLIEASHRASNHGCAYCWNTQTKTAEYAKIMGNRSLSMNQESRILQSTNLKNYFSGLTEEQRKAIYGHSDYWTDEKRQDTSRCMRDYFDGMSASEKWSFRARRFDINNNPEKIANQSKTLALTWKIKRAENRLPEHIVMLPNGRSMREYATSKDVPMTWVYYVHDHQGIQAAQDYITTYDPESSTTVLEKTIADLFGISKYNRRLHHKQPDFKFNDNLFLNCDGLYWHSDKIKENNNYHVETRKAFENNGKRIFQFYTNEIMTQPLIIKSIINNALGNSDIKVHARKCIVKKIDKKIADEFLIKNHLMGVKNGTSHYGLECNGILVSLMSVSRHNEDNTMVLEIDRFCNAIDHSVHGGFSKLLSHVEKIYNPDIIKNWVDLRYGTGKFLEALDFQIAREIRSWKWTDSRVVYNRSKFVANMDDRGLSQEEYAKEFYKYMAKIHDAGQRLYIKMCKK